MKLIEALTVKNMKEEDRADLGCFILALICIIPLIILIYAASI